MGLLAKGSSPGSFWSTTPIYQACPAWCSWSNVVIQACPLFFFVKIVHLFFPAASQPPFVTMPRWQKQKEGRPLSTYTVPPIKLFFQHSLIPFSSSQHLHRHILCCYSQVQSPLLHNCCHQIQQLHCPLSPSSHALPCYKQIGLLCCYCVKPDRRELPVRIEKPIHFAHEL